MRFQDIYSLFEKYHYSFLFLILLFALSIRVYDLSETPAGMHPDEVSSAYNAWSIMKTGRDEHGVFLPLYFEAFNEYKHGFYIYSLIPSLFIFGLTNFAVRITSVVFGMLGIVLLYFIATQLFSPRIALMSTFFLSVMPWHLHHSRLGFEVISFVFLFLLGLFLLLREIDTSLQQRWILLYASAIIFAISLYSYGIARLFVPLFLLGVLFIYRDIFWSPKLKNITIFCIIIFAAFSFPAYYLSFFGDANARFQVVSIFHNSETPFIAFFLNYFSHYSPSFLFFQGDAQVHNAISGWGQLSYSSLLFVPLGIVWIFQNKQKKEAKLLLLWLFLYALPASFTYGDTPHAARTFIAAPLYAILLALGVTQLWTFCRQKVSLRLASFLLIISLLLTAETGILLYDYFVTYKRETSDLWLSFAASTVSYMEAHKNEYQHVYLNDLWFHTFYIYILYYAQADPHQYITYGLESFGYQFCDVMHCFNESEKNMYVLRGFEVRINGTHNIPYKTMPGIAIKFFETLDTKELSEEIS